MSLEAALEKLTAAVERNTEVLRMTGIDVTSPDVNAGKGDEKAPAKTASGPGFWKTADGKSFGQYANTKELEKVKEDHASVETIEKAEYLELKKAKTAADKAAKAKADKAAAAKKEESSEDEHPSEEELIAAFTKYLPKDLDKATRDERAPNVKEFLIEKGAKRATDLKAEQRQEAIDFVNSLVAELEGGESEDDDDMI